MLQFIDREIYKNIKSNISFWIIYLLNTNQILYYYININNKLNTLLILLIKQIT